MLALDHIAEIALIEVSRAQREGLNAMINIKRSVTYRIDEDETIELNGQLFKVTIETDQDNPFPWDDGDGRGIVSEWTTRAKQPGECILTQDRQSRRYFDWAGTMRKAIKEGWSAEPHNEGTKAQRAERAVQHEFDRFRQWCEGQWNYVGVIVTKLEGDDGDYTEGESNSLWGLESDDSEGIAETVKELAEELI